MLEIRERAPAAQTDLTVTLPFEDRQRSRLLVTLSSGEPAALMLARGTVLRGGDTLQLSDGRVLRVEAAPETVSTVQSDEPRALARAAYHLGNRHVPVEVGRGFLRYAHDHVLDGMVRELGLSVGVEEAPFEPEGGAYARGHGHGKSHEHVHVHVHPHEQEHVDAHAHAHGYEHVDEHVDVDVDVDVDAHAGRGGDGEGR